MQTKTSNWLLVSIAALVLGGLVYATLGPGFSGLAPHVRQTLLEIRLARLLTGLLVGAALASAGCALQAVLRNPLAEPFILGLSSGSSCGAALAIIGGVALHSLFALPLSAFIGGIAALGIVYYIHARSQKNEHTLILTGVVVSTILSSTLMLLHSLDFYHHGSRISRWMMGNLQATAWPLIALVATIIVLAILVLWLQAHTLNALILGMEAAELLGVRLKLALPLILGAATLATAAAVSISGIIGFVGLIIPHILRHLVGLNHRRLLPLAALYGALFLVLCDTLARTLLAPREIPVGVITALCGGPFFLYLISRRPTFTASGSNTTPPAAPTSLKPAPRSSATTAPKGTESVLHLEQLSWQVARRVILDRISLRLERAAFVALIGPNGAGKSSLLKAMAGLVGTGHVTLTVGRNAAGEANPTKIALVPQDLPATLPLTGFDFVLLGRTAHLSPLRGAKTSDHQCVQEAMQLTDTWSLRERRLETLSGGERQRLAVAMALAGQPQILLLDEPTAHLDLRHRLALVELLQRLNRERQLTILTVVHDLNLAARYFPRIVVLKNGAVMADGPPAEVLQPALLAQIYEVPHNLIAT